jgi:hypothetical protein
MTKAIHCLTAVIVAVSAVTAQAAMVTFTLNVNEDGAGTFNLYAASSVGDNGGIASYGIPLVGNILTLDHKSPKASGDGSLGAVPVALGLLRTADSTWTPIAASQDTVTPGYIVYGIGQTAGDITTDASPAPTDTAFLEQAVYDATVLVASGTWETTMPGFDIGNNTLLSNVFDDTTGVETMSADITTVVLIPEPASLTLLGLLGLLITRRRLV